MNSISTIVIIGAGFSGTMTALQLLLVENRPRLKIILVDRSGNFGPGLAYSAWSDRFRLNVRSDVMGAWPRDPNDFYSWLSNNGYQAKGKDFVPRSWFGQYIQSLREKLASQFREDSLSTLPDTAVDIAPRQNQLEVRFETSAPIAADRVVLALGNLPRSSFNGIPVDERFSLPYSRSTYDTIAECRKILIIGTGLTTIDTLLECEGQGFQGDFTLLSRNGRLPLSHSVGISGVSIRYPWEKNDPPNLLTLSRWIHRNAKQLGSSQPFIEAIRPHTQAIWRSFCPYDRTRFLRSIRSFWDAHRHRIPPEHDHALQSLIRESRIQLLRGTIQQIETVKSGRQKVVIALKQRPALPVVQEFDKVILCTGPETDISRSTDPLLKNLLLRQLVVPGPLGLGVREMTSPLLQIIGPLQRESLWEITAVRELREESIRVATSLCRSLVQS